MSAGADPWKLSKSGDNALDFAAAVYTDKIETLIIGDHDFLSVLSRLLFKQTRVWAPVADQGVVRSTLDNSAIFQKINGVHHSNGG